MKGSKGYHPQHYDRWTVDGQPESLAGFIQNPTDFAPGTTMALASTYDAEDVADLVAYLRTLD